MKRLIVIVFIVFGSFLTLCLYRTYAYNTTVVEDTPTTTDLEYAFKIGNSSIKEITINSGETRYYDVVMGNPNNAKISYSIYYEMVSPSTKPDGFSIEYTSKSTGDSTGKVDKNGNIILNIVVTNTSSSSATVKLGSIAGYVNGGELLLGSGQELIPKLTASKFIMSLDDGTTGDSGSGVYKVTHEAISASNSATGSTIPATTDYRYYGASPNNYICLDMEEQSACPDKHLYRIIGSIYEENAGQNLLKVIKAKYLTDGTTSEFSWNYPFSGDSVNNNIWASVTNGNYSNSLTSGSQLMKLLNSGAWWNGTSDSYYNWRATTTVNFTNYKLSDKAKSYVTTSRYYLGEYNTASNVLTNQFYSYERGVTRYDTSRPLYWDGNVGLMYSSDYGYASGYTCVTEVSLSDYSGACQNKNWLNDGMYKWLITPNSGSSGGIFIFDAIGIIGKNSVDSSFMVFPTFYLKPTTSISSGDGSSSNPYIIQ